MRVLFLLPGGVTRQLQAVPAVSALAEQLRAQVQVACAPATAAVWKLVAAVEKQIPFDFEAIPSLADWANLLGNVREPDFQACVNLASGRQVDLMLSMSHIPNRVACTGFSATSTVQPEAGWPAQALAAYLRPLGVNLDAAAFRLALPKADLEQAVAAMTAGTGPALLLAPGGGGADWPASRWQELPELVRRALPDLRLVETSTGANLQQRAAQIASADVVLSSDPISTELALLCGTPLVALGRDPGTLPTRSGVQGCGNANQLGQLTTAEVLQALGLG
ncbi:MAG: lipopolysaccharide heptosyltransferase family protein [Synechococcaceae bacterium WB8_1B_136]|nr:lipopolysaccharide heptosyltransferase family protein [Synechococcaceae bacterium WB8_1B_136]